MEDSSKKLEYHEAGLCCDDCLHAIANDDYSGLDYYYSTEESAEREKAIRDGIAAIGHCLVIGDEYGFSWSGCDICGLHLGGNRHAIGYLA